MAESQQIELLTWGRGIHRIFEACRKGGTPEPKLSLSGHDLWTEFPFSEQYLAAMEGKSSEKTTQKTTQKTASTTQRIIELLKVSPTASRRQIAEHLGDITEDGVKYQLNKLKKNQQIRRIGPDKGGHWEVLN